MIVERSSDGRLLFKCPGCGFLHSVKVEGEGRPKWSWNGSETSPTFDPSIKVEWETLSDEARARNVAFYKQNGRRMTSKELPLDKHNVCHSFVRDGKIQFLNDCTHELAGKTVALPEIYGDDDE